VKRLAELREGAQGTVSILHVGDSHVQAGIITGRLREQFQRDFGDAGRGLITPLRMAGTNEPRDYSVTTPYGTRTRKAIEKDVQGTLGLTGVAATFETPYNEFKYGRAARSTASRYSTAPPRPCSASQTASA